MFVGCCLWISGPSVDRNVVISCMCLRKMMVLYFSAANAESKVDTIHLQRHTVACVLVLLDPLPNLLPSPSIALSPSVSHYAMKALSRLAIPSFSRTRGWSSYTHAHNRKPRARRDPGRFCIGRIHSVTHPSQKRCN